MRSSLVRFLICVVTGFLAIPAYGQTQYVNSQSAEYWQSSNQRVAAPSSSSGLETLSCPCDEQPSASGPASAVPAPVPVQTAYAANSTYTTAGYNGVAGQNGNYSTVGYHTSNCCPPGNAGGNCQTGACSTPMNTGYATGGYGNYGNYSACSNGGNCGSCDPCNGNGGYNSGGFGLGFGGFGFTSHHNSPMVDMGCGVFPCGPSQWFLTGWIQQGVTFNSDSPDNRFNGPLKFNDRSNDYQLNQIYLTFGRAVNSEACKWDIGGRVDLLYGTDYFYTSSLGLETETYMRGFPNTKVLDPTAAESKWNKNSGPRANGNAAMYGFSMPQLYGEVQGPIGTNVKLGHFYSPMGHESVMATQNFFYSHSYSMMYGEPTTVTGMLIAQRFTPNLTGYFGMHRGWNKWDTPIDEISYIAGAKWENIYRTTSLGFFINTGKDVYSVTNNGLGRKEGNRTNYSLVFSQQLTPCLHYVLQHDLGVDEDAGWTQEKGTFDGQWYSVAQYLYLQMTPTTALGCRVEWFRDKNHTRILGLNVPKGTLPNIGGDDFVNVSLGLNWKPTSFITFRPEVRWDWADDCNIFDDGKESNMFTVGADLVVNF